MEESLLAKNPKLKTLVAKSNAGNFTYDGIELGGERLCQEIEEEIRIMTSNEQRVTRLSFAGYSLGGLVARYAVGLLHARGTFRDIEPVVCLQLYSARKWSDTNRTSPHLHLLILVLGLLYVDCIVTYGMSLERAHC